MANNTIKLTLRYEGYQYTLQVPENSAIKDIKSKIKRLIPEAEEARQRLLFKGNIYFNL